MQRREFLGVMGIAGAMPLLYGQGLWNLAGGRDSTPAISTHLQGDIMTTQEYLKLFYKGNHPLQKRAGGYFARHIRFSVEAVGYALDEGWRSNGKMRAEDKLSTNELVGLSLGALIALDSLSEYERVLESTLGAQISALEAREICYQATPYVGFARVSAFVERSFAIFEARAAPHKYACLYSFKSFVRWDIMYCLFEKIAVYKNSTHQMLPYNFATLFVKALI